MNILAILISASLALAVLALGFYVWCLKTNQFDDPEGDASRILADE